MHILNELFRGVTQKEPKLSKEKLKNGLFQRIVSRGGYISFRNKRYYVSKSLAGKTVEIKVKNGQIHIFNNNHLERIDTIIK
jgi:hypothetical protein